MGDEKSRILTEEDVLAKRLDNEKEGDLHLSEA